MFCSVLLCYTHRHELGMESNIKAQTLNEDRNQIAEIVINMLQIFKHEAENNKLQVPLEDFEDRVSYYTGIPKLGIKRIQQEVTTTSIMYTHSIDLSTHILILRCLFRFYECKVLPTFRLLFEHVNELKTTCEDYEQFKHKISSWGFEYQTIFNNTKLLMEDPKITFERYSYLKKIKEIRQQDTLIYYINERIIDKDLNFQILKHNYKASDTSNNEWIFFHATSRKGFTRGLFCLHATEDDFYKWVIDGLLGSLYPSSVVVLYNSPLHGALKSKSITIYDTKSDMQKWLQKCNVPCSSTMNKSQLYELIKRHAVIDEINRVDHALRANGHVVLRLPTHLENLSPTKFIWQNIKKDLIAPIEIKDEVLSTLINMPIENYKLYEDYIEEEENEYFSIDLAMDKVLDILIQDLKNRESVS